MLEKSCGWWLIWYFLFFCHGGAEATESRPYIDLNITQSSKVMSPQGQPLVINCGIDGFPKPLITWYKSLEVRAPDDRVRVLSNGSLHFMLLTKGDQAYYYCDGKNDLGQVKSAEIFVEVAYIKSRFEQEPNSQYIRGKSRTLPCSPPASHPPANVTWYKDKQPMKYRTGEHAAYILDPAESIWDLFFTDIQKQDEGGYFCIASNNFAVPMSRTSKSADIQIEGQLQWFVKEKITDYGQDLTLFCPVENCCSKHQAGWFVGEKSKILDVKTFSNDPNSKYHGTNNTDGFGFVIRNLSEADLNVTYHCNYGFNQSIPTYLLHGDVFKESVPNKDKENNTVTESNTVTENNTVAIVLSIVGSIVVAGIVAIIIVCIIKKKRRTQGGTEDEMKTFIPSDDQQGTEDEMKTFIPSDDQQGTEDEMKTFIPSDDQQDSPPKPEEVPLIVVAPGQPRNIEVNVLSPTRIKVSWLPPTDSASITSYTIYFNDLSVMEDQDNNHVLEGLIPDMVYQIQVSAITNDIEGEKSPMIEVKTSPFVVYRVDITFTVISYTNQLDDGNSKEFKSLAENIQTDLTKLFVKVPGMQEVMVKQFKQGSLLTTFDLTSRGYYEESVLRETIEKPLRDGRIGSYKASPVGFTFRSFGDVYRVVVNFTHISYPIQLYDGNSDEFKILAGNIQKVLTALYVNIPGKQEVEVKQFKQGFLLTTFDLTSRGYYEESVLRETIEKPLRDERIGSYKASPVGFTFRSFGVAVVYRVDITVTELPDTKQLDNGNSNEFKRSAEIIQKGLTGLFGSVPGIQEVVVVQFKYLEDSLLTTFDLTSLGYYGESVLRETIEKLLEEGKIGSYQVSQVGFNFRAFSGDFHGAIVEKYRTKPKIPKDLLDDKTFLSKLLEECGKNTEGLYTDSSGGIDVYFPATLLVVVMKYRPETEIVKEVLNDMSTTLTSQSPSPVVIVYHRSVKTAMEKVYKDCKKPVDKEDCEKPKDKEDGEKPIVKEDCEKQIEIFRKFIEKHKFDYSASSCLQQCIYKSRQ